MGFIVSIWLLAGILSVFGLVAVICYGWKTSIKHLQANSELAKIALAIVAAVYTAGVYHVEMVDNRIANTLAFQDKADSYHLRSAFTTLDMFWIRGGGLETLRDYQNRRRAAKSPGERIELNKEFADETVVFVENHGFEDEITKIYHFYKDIVV